MHTMGGVDWLDQPLYDYPIARKREKKYYKEVVFQIFDIVMWNAFVYYKENVGHKDNLEFSQAIIEEQYLLFAASKAMKKRKLERNCNVGLCPATCFFDLVTCSSFKFPNSIKSRVSYYQNASKYLSQTI